LRKEDSCKTSLQVIIESSRGLRKKQSAIVNCHQSTRGETSQNNMKEERLTYLGDSDRGQSGKKSLKRTLETILRERALSTKSRLPNGVGTRHLHNGVKKEEKLSKKARPSSFGPGLHHGAIY